MDMIVFSFEAICGNTFIFGFKSKCLNVGTYTMNLFLGHMDFEFIRPC
jgi:hypothetical protein